MRRATVRTTHDDPGTVAAALRPDNTAEMTTAVADGAVVTTIERETTAGLQSTVDDYVVNLRVAERAARGGDAAEDDAGDAADRGGSAGDGGGGHPSGRDDRSGSHLGEQRDDRPNENPNP